MEEERKEYDKWKSDKSSRGRKIASSINAWHLIGLFLLLVGGSWAMASGKIKPGFFYVSIGLAVIVIIFMAYKGPPGKRLIPEHVIKKICQEILEKKKREGIEIPFDAEVRVTLVGEVKYEQDDLTGTSGVVMRGVGFEVCKKGYRKKGIIFVHPYDGTILDIKYISTGYTGQYMRDVRLVPVKDFENRNPKI